MTVAKKEYAPAKKSATTVSYSWRMPSSARRTDPFGPRSARPGPDIDASVETQTT